MSLGTVSVGLGWSRGISGHFWKSLGLANFSFGIGETSLGLGIKVSGLGDTGLGSLLDSLGMVSVSASLEKWSRRRCLVETLAEEDAAKSFAVRLPEKDIADL